MIQSDIRQLATGMSKPVGSVGRGRERMNIDHWRGCDPKERAPCRDRETSRRHHVHEDAVVVLSQQASLVEEGRLAGVFEEGRDELS